MKICNLVLLVAWFFFFYAVYMTIKAESQEYSDGGHFVLFKRGENWVELSQSRIVLQETDEEGAVAEVTFHNKVFNGTHDNGQYKLKFNNIEITIDFYWNPFYTNNNDNTDCIVINPPSNLIAIPPELCLLESAKGVSYLYPFQGVS